MSGAWHVQVGKRTNGRLGDGGAWKSDTRVEQPQKHAFPARKPHFIDHHAHGDFKNLRGKAFEDRSPLCWLCPVLPSGVRVFERKYARKTVARLQPIEIAATTVQVVTLFHLFGNSQRTRSAPPFLVQVSDSLRSFRIWQGGEATEKHPALSKSVSHLCMPPTAVSVAGALCQRVHNSLR